MNCLELQKMKSEEEWTIINDLNERNNFYDFETCTGMDKVKHSKLYKSFIEGQKYYAFNGTDERPEFYTNYFVMLNNKIIGYVYVTDKKEDYLWISMLLIDKDYQRQGYGKQVMMLCEMMARELGKRTINVDLDISIDAYKKKKNELFKWYASQGYNYLKVAFGQLFLEKIL